jgi:crotonobetainyl-CoA:carnitine CoA-transferase CaiB-like acyl-CoA transferase
LLPEIDWVDVQKVFATNHKRVENRDQLNAILSKAIGQMDSEILLTQIHQQKIPAGIIQNVKEVFELKAANELLMKADSLTGVRSYVAKDSSSFSNAALLPPPHFGEHTAEVLALLNADV